MIQEGLLWFDDSKIGISDKVAKAAARYQQKYGHAATVCYVNAEQAHDALAIQWIRVIPSKTVLPHHFWLGVESKR